MDGSPAWSRSRHRFTYADVCVGGRVRSAEPATEALPKSIRCQADG
jgi:hypothetical protein